MLPLRTWLDQSVDTVIDELSLLGLVVSHEPVDQGARSVSDQ
ncbi:MAG TPA: hypothetical protein VNG13_13725 [Mycobacteriales bacterium]|nr:hypothetical protein [Mycobacteriales bacterium]